MFLLPLKEEENEKAHANVTTLLACLLVGSCQGYQEKTEKKEAKKGSKYFISGCALTFHSIHLKCFSSLTQLYYTAEKKTPLLL